MKTKTKRRSLAKRRCCDVRRSADERTFGKILERVIDKFRENKIAADTIRCKCWTDKYGILEFDIKLQERHCA
jgi:hypothetical protein